MNKSILYVLIVAAAVVMVSGQDQPTPAPTDQNATAQATPTPPPVADITPTPNLSATPQAVATPQPNATVDVAPTPVAVATPIATPEIAPTAAPVVVASPTATPAPQVLTTNRKELAHAPTDTDMYCSGFITAQRVPSDTYVVGGINSPEQTRFEGTDTIYLHGPTLPTGSKVLLLRYVSDPMIETEAYLGQKKVEKLFGHVYQELGIATINGTLNHVMTATFNLVCDSVVPADLAIPLPDRVRPTYRSTPANLDHIGEPNGKLTGRIIFANEFDWMLAQGSRVYLNIGGDQLKPGDYLRITRTYQSTQQDPLDYLGFKNNTDEPTRKQTGSKLHRALMGHDDVLPANNSKLQVGSFPRRTVGELMVLYTTPNSTTAKIVNTMEQVYIGDMVELEEPVSDANTPPVAVVDIPGNGTSTSAGMNPPVITCQAQSLSVHAGEAANVSCTATSADNHPVTVAFQASRGHLQAQDRSASVDTRGLDPGPVSVKAIATDDRNLSASAATVVNVEAATTEAAPSPSKVADLNFKRNSSYVDNRSKAALDDIALRLQKDPSSTAVVVGSNANGEPATLAEQRAKNAGIYLTKDKGIGADRIQSQAGTGGSSGAAVWIVPPGANMPDTNTATPPANTITPDNSNPGGNVPDSNTPNMNSNPNGNPGTPDNNNNNAPVDPGTLIPHNRPIGPA